MTGLLPFEAALEQLLAGAASLPAQTLPLSDAYGRVLAAPLAASLTQPPFAAAAMDGYAVRWADLPGPFTLVGTSAAGHGWPGVMTPGEAVRIFTGAPLPAGADTIAVQEDMTAKDEGVHLSGEGPPHQGAHVRGAGQDFQAGDILIAAGTRLAAAHLGLAAAAGHGTLPVVRRPRVTLIANGDELVRPGSTPGPDQIISSNPAMLAALFAAAGADVSDPGIIPDHPGALAAAVTGADADIIVTIGGASVGDHDLVVPVLRTLGADLDFWRIAMRPGKLLLAGTLGGRRVIGLPGNPVSAFVTALLFVVPLIERLGGRAPGTQVLRLPLAAALPANGARRDHLRARRTPDGVTAFERQDSALLSVLAAADVLIIRPPHATAAQIGAIVDCITLDMFQTVF